MAGNAIISEVDDLTHVALSMEENTCLKGNYFVALNVWRYSRGVVPTEVVITEFISNNHTRITLFTILASRTCSS